MGCIQYEEELYSNCDKIRCSQKVEACDGAYLGLLSRAFKKLQSDTEDFELRTLTDLHDNLKAMKFPTIALGEVGDGTGGCCQNPTQYPSCLQYSVDSHICELCFTCSSCQTRFKPKLSGGLGDHAACSPLARIHTWLDEIINGISGLEYCRYVRRQSPKDVPDLNDDNLWDCLHYSL